MFSFPESYGGTKDGFQVSVDLTREVAAVSEVIQENQDFLDVPLTNVKRSESGSFVISIHNFHPQIYIRHF